MVRLAYSFSCLPKASPYPAHKLPWVARCWAVTPPCAFPGPCICGQAAVLSSCSPQCPTHFRGNFWWWATGASLNCSVSWADQGVCGHEADGSWPCYNLRLLQETTETAPVAYKLTLQWQGEICSIYPGDSLGHCTMHVSSRNSSSCGFLCATDR